MFYFIKANLVSIHCMKPKIFKNILKDSTKNWMQAAYLMHGVSYVVRAASGGGVDQMLSTALYPPPFPP